MKHGRCQSWQLTLLIRVVGGRHLASAPTNIPTLELGCTLTPIYLRLKQVQNLPRNGTSEGHRPDPGDTRYQVNNKRDAQPRS